MARYRMTTEEKLRGVRKGIRVLERKRGGPKWLLPGMRAYAQRLREELKRERAGLRSQREGVGLPAKVE